MGASEGVRSIEHWVGITSSPKELRHYSATLWFCAQFTHQAADQRAPVVIPLSDRPDLG